MSQETIIFVGGPAHGEVRTVKELLDTWRFPVVQQLSFIHENDPTLPWTEVHAYRPRYFAGWRSMNDAGQWVYEYKGIERW